MEVFNSLGCSTVSAVIVINDVGIAENANALWLTISPNPSSDNFTLDYILEKAGSVKINLINITGQLIYSEEIDANFGLNKKQISFLENANGIYYLQIITNENIVTKKIVKN